LSDDHGLDASEITVSVSECEVTLSGEVDSKQAKRLAEDCADGCSGVSHVQNNLRVKKQDNASGT
jgi:osmotically-inducible protein OsmY